MGKIVRFVTVIGLAVALSAPPAHAATRTATAALFGSGHIQRDIFTSEAKYVTVSGTGEGVIDDAPVLCYFQLDAPLSGQARYQGPGTFSCWGVSPFGQPLGVYCTVFVTITGIELDGLGTCEGNANGPLALVMLLIPTNLWLTSPTDTFSALGAFAVGTKANA